MEAGAALLDVREYPEWIESHIPGGTLVPLGDLKSDPQRGALAPEVLTLCRQRKACDRSRANSGRGRCRQSLRDQRRHRRMESRRIGDAKSRRRPDFNRASGSHRRGRARAARLAGAATARHFVVRAVRLDFRGRHRLLRHGQSAGEGAVEPGARR